MTIYVDDTDTMRHKAINAGAVPIAWTETPEILRRAREQGKTDD